MKASFTKNSKLLKLQQERNEICFSSEFSLLLPASWTGDRRRLRSYSGSRILVIIFLLFRLIDSLDLNCQKRPVIAAKLKMSFVFFVSFFRDFTTVASEDTEGKSFGARKIKLNVKWRVTKVNIYLRLWPTSTSGPVFTEEGVQGTILIKIIIRFSRRFLSFSAM